MIELITDIAIGILVLVYCFVLFMKLMKSTEENHS